MQIDADTGKPRVELAILSLLREKYELEGYEFFEYPPSQMLPEFVGTYTPDAVAIRDDKRIAIEIKLQRSPSNEREVRELSHLFSNTSNWTFTTYYYSDFRIDEPLFDTESIDEIRSKLVIVEHIAQMGFISEAFTLTWPLLEAAYRATPLTLPRNYRARPISPSKLVSALEEHGLIPYEKAAILRQMVKKRNALAHGATTTVISREELEYLSDAVKIVLDEIEQLARNN